MSTGLLRITLKKAELTHNCKLLRKMDPYVNFKYKGEKQASAVCNDGHMKPVWQDQTFEFRLDAYCKNIFIQVKDKDLLKAPLIGEADLHVDDLIKKGGVFEWFNLKYKEKSAGKIQLETKFIEDNAAPNQSISQSQVMGKPEETKEEILGEPVALQKSSQSLVLGKAGKSTFKALLVSADMSQGDHLRSFLDHKFYVLMTNHFGEWRSKPAMESGLTPKWTNEQVKIDFKETTNILTIQMKDQKNAQAASPAIGKATVESLLKDGLVDVPLKTPKDETVGYIRFQCFHNEDEQEQAGSDEEVDEKYPHVKPKCMVCNSTHKNNVGTPYACHHCVCIRCNGKGVKKDGNTCTGMKTM